MDLSEHLPPPHPIAFFPSLGLNLFSLSSLPVRSDAFKHHRTTVDDFLWMGREGLMMTGTNGSQAWVNRRPLFPSPLFTSCTCPIPLSFEEVGRLTDLRV